MIQEYKDANSITLSSACRAFGISKMTFYRWRVGEERLFYARKKVLDIAT